MSSVEIVQGNHIFFSIIGSISLVNACETVQRTAAVRVHTCCTFSVSEEGALLHSIPITLCALQLRFHLWLYLIQSGPASRWCCTLLGIFSLHELTFEQLLRASATSASVPASVCLHFFRSLATVCEKKLEEEKVGRKTEERR